MPHFLITGGGTGGHLAIAKALAQELKKRNIQAIYVGSVSGQDRLWFEKSDVFLQSYFLQTTGIVNKKGIAKIQALIAQIKALRQVRTIFKTHHIDIVISVGGFSAGPASIGAILWRKWLFIHEQNAIKGKLNAILTPFAKQVFSAFAKESTPYPLKQEVLDSRRIRKELRTIMFIGGSQGAKAINDFALQIAKELLSRDIHIIHQCGKNEEMRVREAYLVQGILDCVELFGFSQDIVSYLKKADVCVGRAGASSVWENAAMGLLMIYIPYPFAAQNHQVYNAQYFVQKGLGSMLLQSDLTKEHFFAILDTLTPDTIATLSSRFCQEVSQNGAEVIIDAILERWDNFKRNQSAIKPNSKQ